MGLTEIIATVQSVFVPQLCEVEPFKSPADLAVVELCAGCGQLSASFRDLGFQVVPFDHSKNRHHTRVAVYNLDLDSDNSSDILHDLICSSEVAYVHSAPPCGTASKARDRPISHELRKQGVPSPPPLRSAAFPLGLPNLREADRQRVEAANKIYFIIFRIVRLCIKRGILFSIENPASSYYWSFPDWEKFPEDSFEDFDFAGCMHGGDRDRNCRWRATPGLLTELRAKCDNSHQHRPWSVTKKDAVWNFSTAEEAEYPKLLTRSCCLVSCNFPPSEAPYEFFLC